MPTLGLYFSTPAVLASLLTAKPSFTPFVAKRVRKTFGYSRSMANPGACSRISARNTSTGSIGLPTVRSSLSAAATSNRTSSSCAIRLSRKRRHISSVRSSLGTTKAKAIQLRSTGERANTESIATTPKLRNLESILVSLVPARILRKSVLVGEDERIWRLVDDLAVKEGELTFQTL